MPSTFSLGRYLLSQLSSLSLARYLQHGALHHLSSFHADCSALNTAPDAIDQLKKTFKSLFKKKDKKKAGAATAPVEPTKTEDTPTQTAPAAPAEPAAAPTTETAPAEADTIAAPEASKAEPATEGLPSTRPMRVNGMS